MGYRTIVCALSLFACFGCGSAEESENVAESQEALTLVNNKVLRQNAGGKCIESHIGGFKAVNCVQPYPANKKWIFDGSTATGFRVKIVNGGPCITARYGSAMNDTLIQTFNCALEPYSMWKVLPGSGSLAENTFQLQNVNYPGRCIAVDGSGYLRLSACVNTFPAADAQRLLLDEF